jgi:hypothetical protein
VCRIRLRILSTWNPKERYGMHEENLQANATDTSGGGGTPSDGGVTVPMNFEPNERDDYEKVCEQLGVDPEDPDTLGDVLKAKFVGLYVTPVSADD